MVFTGSTTTLRLSTSIGIDPRTFKSKVCDFIIKIYVFYGILIIFEYLFIHCDRFRETKIDLHVPYMIQGIGTEKSGVPNNLKHPTGGTMTISKHIDYYSKSAIS